MLKPFSATNSCGDETGAFLHARMKFDMLKGHSAADLKIIESV